VSARFILIDVINSSITRKKNTGGNINNALSSSTPTERIPRAVVFVNISPK
jgi:hypothetical protein